MALGVLAWAAPDGGGALGGGCRGGCGGVPCPTSDVARSLWGDTALQQPRQCPGGIPCQVRLVATCSQGVFWVTTFPLAHPHSLSVSTRADKV